MGMEIVDAGKPILARIMKENKNLERHEGQVLPSCFPISSKTKITAPNIC